MAYSTLFDNNLPPERIVLLVNGLLAECGAPDDSAYQYILKLARMGWCASEIARALVRSRYPKGDPGRRALLTKLTKLGARAA